MPRKAIDYSNTIIYKIVCKDLEIKDVYVGHTTDFTNRKYQHKSACSCENDKHYNYKVYEFIRENGGWDNFEMIEIEKYNCKDANEARARERYWYEELNATLNSSVPNRNHKESSKEYYELNKDKLKEYKKVWKELNKDKIKGWHKTNYELNKDKLKECIKEYKKINKDKINERVRARKLQKKCQDQHNQQLITTNLDSNNANSDV